MSKRFGWGALLCYRATCKVLVKFINCFAQSFKQKVCRSWVFFALTAAFPGCSDELSDYTRTRSAAIADVDDIHDLGMVNPHESLQKAFSFTIRNTTDVDLDIQRIRTSCGCMTPDDYASHIPARTELSIPFKINIAPEPGPFVKTAIVEFQSKRSRPVLFKVIGTVKATDLLRATPSQIDMGEVDISQHATDRLVSHRRLVVTRFDQMPFKIKEIKCDTERFEATPLTDGRSPIRREHEIDVWGPSGDDEDLDRGSYESELAIYAAHQEIPLRIPVKVNVIKTRDYFKSAMLFTASEVQAGVTVDIRNARYTIESNGWRVNSIAFVGKSPLTVQQVEETSSKIVISKGGEMHVNVLTANLVANIGSLNSSEEIVIPITVVAP